MALLPAVEPDPLKVMVTGAVPLLAEVVMAAVGGVFTTGALAVMVVVATLDWLFASRTVS